MERDNSATDSGPAAGPRGATLTDARVLVTGASGFLGGRLVERLALGRHAIVHAMVRNFASPGLARLARLPVRLVQADLLDAAAVLDAVHGCDYVVHCGYGSSGDERSKRAVTVDGTRNVLEAARQAGCRGIVHVSTAVVHGVSRGRTVREDDPYRYGAPYINAKIEADRLALEFHQRSGLPVAVLRPARIFGPWGEPFTLRIVNDIRNGAVTLVDEGTARANVVYVDNVVDATLLCLTSPAASGQAFIINGDEPVTWKAFCQAYAAMIPGAPSLRSAPLADIERARREQRRNVLTESARAAIRLLRSGAARAYEDIPLVRLLAAPAEPLLRRLFAARGLPSARAQGRLSTQAFPDAYRTRGLATDLWFSSDKIKAVLQYRQETDFETAMRLTRQWLQWARIV